MARELLNLEDAAPKSPAGCAHDLADALERVAGRWYDPARHAMDYGAFTVSQEMKPLTAAADQLAGMDPAGLESTDARLAFWLNAWNTLLLIAIARLGLGESIRSLDGLFSRYAFRIGDHRFSLDDIEHGVLRANAARPFGLRAAFARHDPRLQLSLDRVEPLAHFGFYTACRSAPRLQAFTLATVRARLAEAATELLARTVQIPDSRIWIPRTFHWYERDFGGRTGVIDFLVRHLPDDGRRQYLKDSDGHIGIDHLDYDWTVNDRFSAGTGAT